MGRILRAAGLTSPAERPRSPAPAESPGIPEELRGRLSLFALAGQSNMSGYAPLAPGQAPHPRAFLFANDYRWRPALEPTDGSTGQVDRVSLDRGTGTSPGLAFAEALLAARPELAVGLVPCAKGASTIEEWRRGLGDDTLYGSCLKRMGAAATMGDVAGILFFQGESDAIDPERSAGRVLSAADYSVRLTRLVHDLRSDLGRPRLPVVFAQIGGTTMPERYVNWRLVQEQQASVRLPCVAMITTSDLTLRDNVHFTAQSYQEIGRRFARAYLELTAGQDCE
jgi:lysophospholipase L1-like esterase